MLDQLSAHIGLLVAIIDLPMYRTLGSVIHFSLHYVCFKCYYSIFGLDTILIFLHRVNKMTQCYNIFHV